MARKVYGTNKRGRSWKWSRTRPDGDALGRAEIATRHGFGWDASPDTGVGVLGPTVAAVDEDAEPGSIVVPVTGLAYGESIASFTPDDGRFVLDVSRRSLLVGGAALAAGSVAVHFVTSHGRTLDTDVTVESGVPAGFSASTIGGVPFTYFGAPVFDNHPTNPLSVRTA